METPQLRVIGGRYSLPGLAAIHGAIDAVEGSCDKDSRVFDRLDETAHRSSMHTLKFAPVLSLIFTDVDTTAFGLFADERHCSHPGINDAGLFVVEQNCCDDKTTGIYARANSSPDFPTILRAIYLSIVCPEKNDIGIAWVYRQGGHVTTKETGHLPYSIIAFPAAAAFDRIDPINRRF